MTILYSAPIGFDNYHNEVRRDTKAMESVLRAEGIPFVPFFDGETREEDYFGRNDFDAWEEFVFYSEELTAILADNGIAAYADGYAGMFYIERETA